MYKTFFFNKTMKKIKEVWKNIPNYENYYQVSNFGNIKSLDRYYNGRNLKGKPIKLSPNKFGYLRFTAKKDNITKTLHVHRVVLLTFNPIVQEKQVNHIDGNKFNNRLENLEWCTDSENKIHAYKNGLMIGGNQYSKHKVKSDLPRYK